MIWPTKNYWISLGYSKSHQAIDFASIGGNYGQKIIAPVSGVVTAVGTNPNYIGGLYIIIRDNEGYEHYTGHHQRTRVKVGQKVKEGRHIADMGATGGKATGPHTHYQIRNSKGNLINPKTLYNERTMYNGKTAREWFSVALSYDKRIKDYQKNYVKKTEYNKLQKELSKNTKDIEALVKEQDRLRAENSDVKTAFSECQEATQKLAKEHGALETEVDKLETANTKLNDENKRLKKDVTVKDAISVIIDKIVSLIRR